MCLLLQECALQKTFGEPSDNVVFVLENGSFNITALVDLLQSGLSNVLGEFSSFAGSVVESPKVAPILGVVESPKLAPILSSVNAAASLLG